MNIFKRGDCYWYNFSVDGRRYRGTCGTADETKAKRVLAKKYDEAWKRTKLGEKPRRTWVETLNRWLEEHKHKRTHLDDVKYGAFWTEKFAARRIVYLDQVLPEIVKEIRDAELRRPRQRDGKPMSPATVNRKMALLRAVMLAASRAYLWIEATPKFQLLPEQNERVRFLSPVEVQRLLRSLEEPYRSAALLAVSTGLRQANVLRLSWSQVDMGRRMLTFPDKVMKNGLPFSLPITDAVLEAIRPWIGKHPERVFVNAKGEPVNSIESKMWAAAIKRAGIKDFKWHDLRHTWASLMRQSGKSLDVIQELGGWISSDMVQRYAHLSVDHLRQHAATMDSVLGTGLAQESGSGTSVARFGHTG